MNRNLKCKIFRKTTLNLIFGQKDWPKSDFARSNLSIGVVLKIFQDWRWSCLITILFDISVITQCQGRTQEPFYIIKSSFWDNNKRKEIFLQCDRVLGSLFGLWLVFFSMSRVAGWCLLKILLRLKAWPTYTYLRKLEEHLRKGLFHEGCGIKDYNSLLQGKFNTNASLTIWRSVDGSIKR